MKISEYLPDDIFHHISLADNFDSSALAETIFHSLIDLVRPDHCVLYQMRLHCLTDQWWMVSQTWI